jgi:hypothetical protein
MRVLGEREMLSVWTEGERLHPIDRTLALLSAATGAPRAELARTSLGARNGLALELRERTFGAALDGTAACPACGAELELSTSTSALRSGATHADDAALALSVGGVELVLRRLDSADLAAIVPLARDDARRALLARAIVSARRAGEPVEPEALPDDVVAAIAERLTAADPLLDLRFAVACPSCGHAWSAPFDPGAFLWTEVAARARRLVRDVHDLAVAYGWSEADALAVPAARRRAYLAIVRGDA